MRTLHRAGALAVLAAGGLLLAGTGLHAGDKKGVDVGDKAPAFQARDDQGRLWKSSDHVGKKTVVVFFYPAALTGG